jgi:phosphoenolpyruvate-protein phosphotransferase/dihydroxyacetone kinase phosphotransfer subunit
MIGIVIVSHSGKLADGLKEMAEAMSTVDVPIVSAGGVDDANAPLGTDATKILNAVRDVMSDDGVLIFADIGSARLNAEMAIDLLDDIDRARTRFCDAPLVEGVLTAAIQIAAGGTLEAVIAEAQSVAGSKVEPIGTPTGTSREFTVTTKLGLHARPAALLVEEMARFKGDVFLTNLTKSKPPVSAKSINGVMLSEVREGDKILITADPDEAERVFASIAHLVGAKPSPKKQSPEPQNPTEIRGISVSRGIAIGPLHHMRRNVPDIIELSVPDTKQEVERFEAALAQAERDIMAAVRATGQTMNDGDKKVFDAHIAYLHDADIIETVKSRISSKRLCAEAVWHKTITDLSGQYSDQTDPVLQLRAADIRDIGLRVLGILIGEEIGAAPSTPAILAYDELYPSDLLTLDILETLGICCVSGGVTSHAGILSSALPIPVVFGLANLLDLTEDGQNVGLDGGAGLLYLSPDEGRTAQMKVRKNELQKRKDAAHALLGRAAETKDGHHIRVAANMAGPSELSEIVESGAEEVGLLRTEFLFMGRDTAPDEMEQTEIYTTIVKGLGGRPLTIRTIDIGGDKTVPYMDRPEEANPNLGWRGVRYSLDESEMFKTQLRAILRASVHGPVRIMLPLVSTLDEILAAQKLVEIAKSQLRDAGQPFDEEIEFGIMIEVPAAAEMADVLAPEVDFFSIGTNDLTQYMMAADRGNEKVQSLFDPFNPAVLRMVQKSIAAAHEAGIWIGMCGAMAGNPLAAPVLIGLGLDEFSMNAADIPEFKMALQELSHPKCRKIATEVVKLPSSKAVKDYVTDQIRLVGS